MRFNEIEEHLRHWSAVAGVPATLVVHAVHFQSKEPVYMMLNDEKGDFVVKWGKREVRCKTLGQAMEQVVKAVDESERSATARN